MFFDIKIQDSQNPYQKKQDIGYSGRKSYSIIHKSVEIHIIDQGIACILGASLGHCINELKILKGVDY
ncbi:hypothetical protein SDC9_124231 [bioreactor metagenome]|uniref:Uncharacterized protein n=1 Tax=bioreactor metagenome TaxID=1076179 RepID=A0A645CJV6_9ZZZZ